MNEIIFGKRKFVNYNEALTTLWCEAIDVGPAYLVLTAFDYDKVFNKFWTFEDEVDKMVSWVNKALSSHGFSVSANTRKSIVHSAVRNYEFVHFEKKEG